jgi:predicted nucleic acid-binding protein
MKAIVDTCVWSLALRRLDQARMNPGEQVLIAELKEAIQDRRAAIVGPIRQKVLSGVRDKASFAKIKELLDPFPDEPIAATDYVEAARLFNVCRDRGVECGAVDILVCAVAARKTYGILTCDHGLQRCIEALRTAEITL